MISLYITPSCTSCRKAKKWLDDNNLSYQARNIFTEPLTKDELLDILMLTENGTEDIISERSKVYQKLDIDFDELSLSELVAVLQENPSMLRRPLISDGKKLQIGYNEDDIRQFVPREIRELTFLQNQKMTVYLANKDKLLAKAN